MAFNHISLMKEHGRAAFMNAVDNISDNIHPDVYTICADLYVNSKHW